MYPWDVLGIDETDDKKLIKKAYAKLIRLHRPEDEPEKFQEINHAYQYALSVRSASNEYSLETTGHINDELIFAGKVDRLDPVELESACLIDFKTKIKQLLNERKAVINNLKNWQFIDELYDQLNRGEQFNMSCFVFQKVFDTNHENLKEFGELLIFAKTLQHCDSVFDWSNSWKEYQYLFTANCFRFNLDLIEGNSDYDTGGFAVAPWKRLLAFLSDLALILVVVYILTSVANLQFSLMMFLTSFIIYQIIVELILGKDSMGCLLLRYKLMSLDYNETNTKQRIIRLAVFHLAFLPVYMVFSDKSQLISFAAIAAVIMYPVMIFIFFGGNKLMHDEISSTKMIPI